MQFSVELATKTVSSMLSAFFKIILINLRLGLN